ncbi:MAG: glycosyltransferase family 2 protein [Candidatus Thiodiazotropha endolucinida]
MLISLIVPIHNEQDGLARFWQAVSTTLEQSGYAFEVVMVDDGSTDESWQLISELTSAGQSSIDVTAIRLSRNFGKEAAILAGLRRAGGSAAIVIDADLQHPPKLIPSMLDIWDKGKTPIVEGVKRKRQHESTLKRVGATLYYRIFKLSSGLDMQGASDFKLLDRSVIDHYINLPETTRYFRGLTAWMGFDSAAIEFEPPNREVGMSGWSIRNLLALARTTIISFSSLPLRIVTWLGVIGLIFSLGLTIQTLWYKWMGYAEEGFPTVILLILGMGSMILFGLGLIGEYIGEIYREVKRRPSYIVSDIRSTSDRGGNPGSEQPTDTQLASSRDEDYE